MPKRTRYDALVVGARCAGATTAMLMARRGMRVLAIDRGAYGADALSTHALMRGGILQLHRWGVLPRLLEMGTPPVRSTTFHYGDEVLELPVKPGHGVDALLAPRRTLLDSVLVDAAQEAGAEVRHQHTLTDLIRDGSGRVRGACVVDDEGRCAEIEAGLVVGADGLGSAVARLVDASLLRVARHTSAVIYGHWSGLRSSGYHWHYRPGVSAGVMPTNAGRHCIFVAMPPARMRDLAFRADPAMGYRRVLAEVSPALAEAVAASTLESRLWAFAGRKGFLRVPSGPGWALVGDAGYFKDPLTAHGITDAFRDAELLADAATRGSEADFADYAARRDELSVPLFEATDAIASFDWNLDRLKTYHQALNAAMRREVEHLLAARVGDPIEAGGCR
ncbi:NAD(P)/FAD-dependent oxidoreductase [Sabulicella glaciei]|uniref:NAD(P)/FAD-dependent oxidoreductase n=1 Tax=Sabulicella glaciei TaxID=2984948 RepID=A0ABT3NS99_9PROT|nr:NAD(P)/FAD-dependent oxidoreductase [Roseococcus sp. MDT2-1-1]MCW8085022.1 NAD(P)/FAD-dependent oxidoreductase [Roseococcus sp. MDT2-1-1]